MPFLARRLPLGLHETDYSVGHADFGQWRLVVELKDAILAAVDDRDGVAVLAQRSERNFTSLRLYI